MNWYVKYEGTEEISAPMTQEEALAIVGADGGVGADGMVFNERIFEPKFVNTEAVEGLLAEMRSAASARPIMSPDQLYLDAQGLLTRAIDTITLLSREKVITGKDCDCDASDDDVSGDDVNLEEERGIVS